MGWEGQPPAAPMDAVRATRHHSCTALPAQTEWDSGEGERRSEGGHQMCADHTLCMVCMVCSHHPNHTPSLSQLHADGMWIGREGEERGRRERQLTPSLHHTSSWHTPPLISSPSPFSSTSSVSLHPPPIHTLSSPLTWLTTTSTSLLLSLTRPNPHPMHVPVHRGNAAAAAAPLLVFLTTTSSSCPPPPACHTCTHKQQVVHV